MRIFDPKEERILRDGLVLSQGDANDRKVMESKTIVVRGEDYTYTDRGTVFVWEISKADIVAAREIDLMEVASVFADDLALARQDKKHPGRGNYIGASEKHRLLMVVYVEVLDDFTIRVITAREADSKERERYRNAQRPKADTDSRGWEWRKGKERRDPAFGGTGPVITGSAFGPSRGKRTKLTFLEFFRAHHPSYRPKMAQLPPKGFRSRLPGNLGKIQNRAWAFAHALKSNTVGARVSSVRKIVGLTQAELAKLSGVAPASLSRIERDVERLGIRRAEALAKALRIQPSELLWGRK